MKQIITILLMITVLLCGCGNSGVLQEEYDRVVAERDELKNEKQNEETKRAKTEPQQQTSMKKY